MKQLQELQDPTCPTCGKPIGSVYCSSTPDSAFRLYLKEHGLSRYTALHRVNTTGP